MDFNGVHLFILAKETYQVFRQRDKWEVLGLYSFVISSLGECFPLGIVNMTRRISKWIGCHFHYRFWELMLSEAFPDNSHVARSNSLGSRWNWGLRMLGTYWYSSTSGNRIRGRRLSCSRSGCQGPDRCWEAMAVSYGGCHCPDIMRLDLGKFGLWRVFIGQANGFSYPMSKVGTCSKHLHFSGSATSGNGIRGRRLSCSKSGCQGRDGCWEAMRITVVPLEDLIQCRVLGTMGSGGKA